MTVEKRLNSTLNFLKDKARLVLITKRQKQEDIMSAYNTGQRLFGESRVQELMDKKDHYPDDVEWHMVGHLQTNKVKYIAPFISLIHSVDSERLLETINKQGAKHKRVIDVLLEIQISRENTKHGFQYGEAEELLKDPDLQQLKNVRIRGLMGMASNTPIESVVREEFGKLAHFYEECKALHPHFDTLSMGMSSDYRMAVKLGSNMVRIGSAILGPRPEDQD
ncbi:MAG TPA: YggS family pyridoxal phosphate-dependent enzyme [Flavobacteriales bacterium]|jgi:pyridoxal phosphate enzyme (YggS family)|nr:YggS family pyridoxal phosphate-dependent enzyme [Flavobacteriales bacterium]